MKPFSLPSTRAAVLQVAWKKFLPTSRLTRTRTFAQLLSLLLMQFLRPRQARALASPKHQWQTSRPCLNLMTRNGKLNTTISAKIWSLTKPKLTTLSTFTSVRTARSQWRERSTQFWWTAAQKSDCCSTTYCRLLSSSTVRVSKCRH